MEATSIASSQGRLDGTRFSVLVFTNLTQDHLDFHGGMDAYYRAKRALFDQVAGTAVINVADPYGRRIAAERPDAITFDESSSALDGIDLRLQGSFNRLNAIGAALAARALGVEPDAIRQGIESVSGVPGRFESIDEGQPFSVIVDYAHTPDSLENVLRAAAGVGRRLIVVFGAVVTALVPLAVTFVAIGVTFGIVTLLSNAWELSIFATNVITGIGLAVVEGIVHRAGGHLAVQSARQNRALPARYG